MFYYFGMIPEGGPLQTKACRNIQCDTVIIKQDNRHSTGILGKGTYAPTNIGGKRVAANKVLSIFAAWWQRICDFFLLYRCKCKLRFVIQDTLQRGAPSRKTIKMR